MKLRGWMVYCAAPRLCMKFSDVKIRGSYRIAVHKSRVKRLKGKIKGLTKKMRGNKMTENIKRRIMPVTRGWANYFKLAEERKIFESLDGWIRRKMRGVLWRQWKRPRTRYKRLMAHGLKERSARRTAYSSKGPWRMARTAGMHRALANQVIEEMGYVSMASIVRAGS